MPHRVFIVEDEIVVRESIRDNVNWEGINFVLVGEASDGEMALPLIQEMKPDILITDIKMPFMDGLTLARLVKKNMPWIKTIIISGYDEFSFAKEAIQISVADYLLKPLSSADLVQTLEKIGAIIEKENREREYLDGVNRSLRDSNQIVTEKFLNDLTTGAVPSAEAIDRAKQYGVDIIARFYMAAVLTQSCLGSGNAGDSYYEYLKSEKLIRDFLGENSDVLSFVRNVKKTVLIFKGDAGDELERSCHSICHSVKYEIERKTSCRVSISIGGVKERIHGIAESLAEAESAARYDFIFGENKIVSFDDTVRANCRTDSLLQVDTREIQDLLRLGDPKELDRTLENYFKGMDITALSLLARSFMIMDITLQTARFIEEIGGDPLQDLPQLNDLETAVRAREEKEIVGFLRDLIAAAFRYREACQDRRYGNLIERAEQCIAQRYADADFSLNEIADHVGISPSHFSTIFSQETGNTFIARLTEKRIRKAKEFLKTTALRSSEIAYKVGYKDPHYFSYIFKTNTGKTPTEYRKGQAVKV